MDVNKDYYAILGVHQTAEDLIIKVAYRTLGKKYHPDTFLGSKEDAHRKMSQVNEAYEVLADLKKRQTYDELRGTQPHDSSTHYDEESTFDSTGDPLKDSWKMAIKYRPELHKIEQHLSCISFRLSYTFRAFILETKEFDSAKKIAATMESDFFQSYFGSNQQVISFAKYLINTKNKNAAKELNKVISIFGNNINIDEVIRKISDEFNVKKQVDLTKLDLSGLSSDQKDLVLKCATELIDCGSSLQGSKNNWKILRGSLATFSYSLHDLTKNAQSHIKHYQSK